MPDRKFLEEYPLYRKFNIDIPENLREIDSPAVHMQCPVCGSPQTFNYVDNIPGSKVFSPPARGEVAHFEYRCALCDGFSRHFLLKFDPEGTWVEKVGQEPPWEISIDPSLERALGQRAEYFKKGLICESQSYGIAAFSYYRRIVEEIIDDLLADIAELVTEPDQQRFQQALEEVRQTKATEKKISLVKELLPDTLRPGGMNPLSALHDALSEGLHAKLDEQCVELAVSVRQVIEYLAVQIATRETADKRYKEGMRKILDRRRKQSEQ